MADYQKIGYGASASKYNKLAGKEKEENENISSDQPFHFIGLNTSFEIDEIEFRDLVLFEGYVDYTIIDYNDFNGFVHMNVGLIEEGGSGPYELVKSSSFLPSNLRSYSHMSFNNYANSVLISKTTHNIYLLEGLTGILIVFCPFDNGFYMVHYSDQSPVLYIVKEDIELGEIMLFDIGYEAAFASYGPDNFSVTDRFGNLYLYDSLSIYSSSKLISKPEWEIADGKTLYFDPLNMLYFAYGEDDKVLFLNQNFEMEELVGFNKGNYQPYNDELFDSRFAFSLWDENGMTYFDTELAMGETPLGYGLLKLTGNEMLQESYIGLINGVSFFRSTRFDPISAIIFNDEYTHEFYLSDALIEEIKINEYVDENGYTNYLSIMPIFDGVYSFVNELYVDMNHNFYEEYLILNAIDEEDANQKIEVLYETGKYNAVSEIKELDDGTLQYIITHRKNVELKIKKGDDIEATLRSFYEANPGVYGDVENIYEEDGFTVYVIKYNEKIDTDGFAYRYNFDTNQYEQLILDDKIITKLEKIDHDTYAYDQDGNKYLLDGFSGQIIQNKNDNGYEIYEFFESEQ